MGYQTRALPGSGTWMMESGIRNRITEWYLFVEKKKIQILQKFSMFRKEADLGYPAGNSDPLSGTPSGICR